MAAPTRTQIEADVARPTFAVVLDGVDVSADVLDVSGDLAQVGGAADGIGFGAVVQPTATVQFAREQFSRAWEERSISISYGFDTSDLVMHFRGVVTGMDQDRDTGSWACRGFDALIESTDVRSLVVERRPIATATTATSVEDPASPSYRAGLVNLVFWTAGGRPWEQQGFYPGAVFYYQCDTAVLDPPYAWLNGENGMEALGNLCRAAGGIVFQDSLGRMRYVDPLSLALGGTTFAYSDAPLTGSERVVANTGSYGAIRRSASTEIAVGTVRSAFVQRYVQGVQQLYSDRTPIQLQPGESRTLQLDLQLPCVRLDRVEIVAALAARVRRATASEVTLSSTLTAAQRITAAITNATQERVTLWEVAAYGQPLVAGEEGSASYSAAVSRPRARDLELEDSPYIQTREFAERRCRMYWDFYSQPRPIVTLSSCGFDPDRHLGEVIALTCSSWGMVSVPHRIVALRPATTGTLMDVDLVPIAALPRRTDFFMGDAIYSNNSTLELSY